MLASALGLAEQRAAQRRLRAVGRRARSRTANSPGAVPAVWTGARASNAVTRQRGGAREQVKRCGAWESVEQTGADRLRRLWRCSRTHSQPHTTAVQQARSRASSQPSHAWLAAPRPSDPIRYRTRKERAAHRSSVHQLVHPPAAHATLSCLAVCRCSARGPSFLDALSEIRGQQGGPVPWRQRLTRRARLSLRMPLLSVGSLKLLAALLAGES